MFSFASLFANLFGLRRGFSVLPMIPLLLLISFAAGLDYEKPGIITIPLDKQYVPVTRENRTVTHKTAYFGTIKVGWPQRNFTVVFDTGSGHLILPSVSCNTATCKSHQRYDQRLSKTSVEIDYSGKSVEDSDTERDQVAIAFGTGEVVGEYVYELICLNPFAGKPDLESPAPGCTKARLITASEMTSDPFDAFNFDGVLGLGLESLALHPEFSFFTQLSGIEGQLAKPQFGVFISQSDATPSEISFGGHDARRIAEGGLHWAPTVRPRDGYWQVRLRAVRIGDWVLPLCEHGDCMAIIDTGTSLVGVPKQSVRGLHWQLARSAPGAPEDLDCRQWPGPDLVFEVEAGEQANSSLLELRLGPQDYSRPGPMRMHNSTTNSSNVFCRSSLLPVDMGSDVSKTFIFGEPMLKKYYTTFDWAARRVGFALAQQPAVNIADAPRHRIFGAPPEASPQLATIRA